MRLARLEPLAAAAATMISGILSWCGFMLATTGTAVMEGPFCADCQANRARKSEGSSVTEQSVPLKQWQSVS
jgi:hypothetical protein